MGGGVGLSSLLGILYRDTYIHTYIHTIGAHTYIGFLLTSLEVYRYIATYNRHIDSHVGRL